MTSPIYDVHTYILSKSSEVLDASRANEALSIAKLFHTASLVPLLAAQVAALHRVKLKLELKTLSFKPTIIMDRPTQVSPRFRFRTKFKIVVIITSK